MQLFYVVLHRAKRTAWLLGPFAKHEDATANVDAAVAKACEADPWCWFDPFGTAAVETSGTPPQGRLNHFFPHLFPPVAA